MAIDWQSRRDGFDHRRDKPADHPINWKYWASLPALKQWEACALSVNVNPDNLKAKRMVMPGMPEFLPESFPSRSVELEFDRRLTMFNRYAEGNHLAVVRPQWFAGWCGHVGLEDLPPELVAMATPEPKAAPVAMPEPTPAPVVAVGALGGMEPDKAAPVDETPWLVVDPKDPIAEHHWFTPARYFARQLVRSDSTLLNKKLVLADKVSRSLYSVGIYKRGGRKRHAADTVLKAFSNVTWG